MKYEYNTDQVIEALYDNADPVSIDGADHMQELVAHIKELQSRLESLEKDAALMLDALKDALCSLEISRQSDYVTSKVRKAIDTAMQANKGE